jgi:flagellar L-ring protein precursor FlgH
MSNPYRSISKVALAALFFAQPLAAESLWLKNPSAERSMFADRTASDVGDILTVIVTESSSQTAARDTSTSKDASINNSVTQWLFPPAVNPFGTSGGALPGTEITGSNTYAGGGSISNRQVLSGRAAVMVTDSLPNGNLVIEGVRIVTFSGETTFAVIRGIIRGDDITTDNTIASSDIADARVEFIAEGTLTDAQKKGWLLRLNEALNPF